MAVAGGVAVAVGDEVVGDIVTTAGDDAAVGVAAGFESPPQAARANAANNATKSRMSIVRFTGLPLRGEEAPTWGRRAEGRAAPGSWTRSRRKCW